MDDHSPKPEQTYLRLRERILSLNPAELGLSPNPSAPNVWGLLVELGYAVGTASLVALADGTTSLHYSTGGGLLGSSDYAPLAEASRALVAEGQKCLDRTLPTNNFDLPLAGLVNFILLTYSGSHAASAPEKILSAGSHPLSTLYQRAQDTLDQLRLLAKRRSDHP